LHEPWQEVGVPGPLLIELKNNGPCDGFVIVLRPPAAFVSDRASDSVGVGVGVGNRASDRAGANDRDSASDRNSASASRRWASRPASRPAAGVAVRPAGCGGCRGGAATGASRLRMR
jgi:hypothetical protein